MPAVDYDVLARSLEDVTPKARIATDHLRTLSYGTDASFYRLIPRIVVTVESEAEVIATHQALMPTARASAAAGQHARTRTRSLPTSAPSEPCSATPSSRGRSP